MARNDVVEPVTLATSLIKEWWTSAVARNEVVEPATLASSLIEEWWTLLGLNQ